MIESHETTSPPVGTLKRTAGLDLLLLGLASLVAVGSLEPWLNAFSQSPTTFRDSAVSYTGMSRYGGGYGWITLIFATCIAAGIIAAIIRRSESTHMIVATLFGSAAVVATTAVLELTSWYNSYFPPVSIGWGLWLSLSSAAAAFFLSIYRCVRHHKTEA